MPSHTWTVRTAHSVTIECDQRRLTVVIGCLRRVCSSSPDVQRNQRGYPGCAVKPISGASLSLDSQCSRALQEAKRCRERPLQATSCISIRYGNHSVTQSPFDTRPGQLSIGAPGQLPTPLRLFTSSRPAGGPGDPTGDPCTSAAIGWCVVDVESALIEAHRPRRQTDVSAALDSQDAHANDKDSSRCSPEPPNHGEAKRSTPSAAAPSSPVSFRADLPCFHATHHLCALPHHPRMPLLISPSHPSPKLPLFFLSLPPSSHKPTGRKLIAGVISRVLFGITPPGPRQSFLLCVTLFSPFPPVLHSFRHSLEF